MKRNAGRLIVSGLVLAVLLGWVLTRERGRAPEKGEVFKLKIEQAQSLQVKTQDRTITVRKEGDQWMLAEPVRGWADKDAAERMVKAMTQLKPTGSRKNADLKNEKFGLAKPALTATLTYDGNKTAVLYLGAQTPDNAEYFGQIDTRNKLYFIPVSVYNDLTQTTDALRDKSLAHVEKDAVKAVTLQYPDRVLAFEKTGTPEKPQWMLTQPYSAKADEWAVKQIADKLADLKAEGFAEEKAPAGKSYGLDKPALKATVTTADGKQFVVSFGATGQEAIAGAAVPGAATPPTSEPKEIVYTQVEGRPEVLLVAGTNMTDLQKTDMDLRDKRIVDVEREQIHAVKVERKEGLSFTVERAGPDSWRIAAPSPGKANKTKVEDILWDIDELEAKEFLGSQKDLKPYGLALPGTIVTVTPRGGEAIKIYLGYEKSDGLYYARTSQSDQVYVVGEMLLLDLPKKVDELKDTGTMTPPAGADMSMPPGAMPPGTMPAMPPPAAPGHEGHAH